MKKFLRCPECNSIMFDAFLGWWYECMNLDCFCQVKEQTFQGCKGDIFA